MTIGLRCPVPACEGRVRVTEILGRYPIVLETDDEFDKGDVVEQARGRCTEGHGPLLAERDPDGGEWTGWRREPQTATRGCVCLEENRETCLGGLPA